MILLNIPTKVLVTVIEEDEDLLEISEEIKECNVLFISTKYQEGETEGKDTFVIMCADSEGNIYERYLNEVKMIESIHINNLKSSNYETYHGPAQGLAATGGRRRKKNRKRVGASEHREVGTEKRSGDIGRRGITAEADET